MVKNLEDLTTDDLDNEKIVKELYVYENYKQTELADIFSTYRGKVRKKLQEHGIKKGWEQEDLMKELYTEAEMSTVELADYFNTGTTTIQRWLDRHGIEKRPSNRDKPPRHEWMGGYERIKTTVDDRCVTFRIHRLIAIAEYGIEPVLHENKLVHHKNGVKWDNRPKNLELMTNEEHGKHHMGGVPNSERKNLGNCGIGKYFST